MASTIKQLLWSRCERFLFWSRLKLYTTSYHGDLSQFKMSLFCETESQDWHQSQWVNVLILLCEMHKHYQWTSDRTRFTCLQAVTLGNELMWPTTSILMRTPALLWSQGDTDLHRIKMTNRTTLLILQGYFSNISNIDPISATCRHLLPKTVNNYGYMMWYSQLIM